MPFFRYTANPPEGLSGHGVVKAADHDTAWRFLQAEGYRPLRLRPHLLPPPLFPVLVVGVFVVTLGLLLAALLDYGARRGWRGLRLLREGELATGTVVACRRQPADGPPDYTYRYADASAGVHEGIITCGPGLRLRQGAFPMREFGYEPQTGEALTVTYLPTAPAVHVPYAITAERLWPPVRRVVGPALLVLSILAGVVMAYAWHLRQTRPQRSQAHLDDGGPPELVTLVRGEFIPLDRPRPATRRQAAGTAAPVVLGWVEREGWRGYVQLAACLAVYYTVASLLWLGAPRTLPSGAALPSVVGLAVGCSWFMVPVLLVLLGMKVRGQWLVSGIVVVLVLQGTAAWAHADGGWLTELVRTWPLLTLSAWSVPAAALVAVERWRGLWVRLGLLVPVAQHPDGGIQIGAVSDRGSDR